MRKLILSAASIAFLAFAGTTVKASTLSQSLNITHTSQDSLTKTAVKLEEIPDSVKATLKSDKVKDWIPSAAFLVKTKEGAEYYQIDLTKGEEKAFLRIDKDGKIVQ